MEVVKFNVQHLGPSGLSAFEQWKIEVGQPSATWENYMEANKGEAGANGLSAFEQWKLETSQPTATWADYMEANKGENGQDGMDGTNARPYFIQNTPIIDMYSQLDTLASTLTIADANKAWVNRGDGLIYVWDGTSFPAANNGLETHISNVDVIKKALDYFVHEDTDIVTDNLINYANRPTQGAIHGVSPIIGNQLLRFGNTYSPQSGLVSTLYYNIPIVRGNSRIKKVIFHAPRVGGLPENSNVHVLATDSLGVITYLVGSNSSSPSGIIEHFEFDVEQYTSISVMCVFNVSSANNAERYIIVRAIETIENTTVNSVKNYIDDAVAGFNTASVVSATYLSLDTPTSMPRLDIMGALPTDITDARTPTDVEFTYSYNGSQIFKCKSTLSVQGNATAMLAKKGYECALTNYNDQELKIQFGKWIACSEFHLKAFPNDQTMVKDVGSARLWKQIRKNRPFPKSYIADFNSGQFIDSHRENLLEQALFYPDGFPIEVYNNGVYHGLYVLRLKKDRDNYMINRDNANHVFLDNETGIDWTTFDYSNWKVRSPRLSGYEDGGVITDTALMSKLNRWWNWFKGIKDNTIDFEATANDYINIDGWVDWIICQQLTAHWDSQVNNMLPISWDGQRLDLMWYDGDQTFGWVTATNTNVQVDSNGLYWRNILATGEYFFRDVIYPKLLTRIKERYTQLRSDGIITTNNIHDILQEISQMIPREAYERELNKWYIQQPNSGKHNLRYILNWTNNRIPILDSIWLLP